jgi:hypothetical protein
MKGVFICYFFNSYKSFMDEHYKPKKLIKELLGMHGWPLAPVGWPAGHWHRV